MWMLIPAGLASAVILFLIIVALRPSHFHVVRTALISAPPAAVFVHINDFRKWEAWSPWAKRDPAARNGFEGPASGTGAVFTWSGNHEVGRGRMTITEHRPSERVCIRLEFFKPFACTNAVEFNFAPEGSQTKVTWSMAGKNNFMAKAIGLFMDCDKMVGGDFEKGLANLRAIAEGQRA